MPYCLQRYSRMYLVNLYRKLIFYPLDLEIKLRVRKRSSAMDIRADR